MTSEAQERKRRLTKLARWRESELDDARTVHVQLTQMALQKASQVDRVTTEITDVQAYARGQLRAAQAFSVDSVRRLTEFSALKAVELKGAQREFEASQAEADAAHGVVLERFEGLSVVERLQERLAHDADVQRARLDQKQLDEQALSRFGADRTNRRED